MTKFEKWLKRFLPGGAKKFPDQWDYDEDMATERWREMSPVAVVKASIRKWQGLSFSILREYDAECTSPDSKVIFDSGDPVYVDASTCSLCAKYSSGIPRLTNCIDCPSGLAEIHDQ